MHAQARLTPLATAEPPAIDLAAIRERLPESIDHERYYAEFAAAGYQFGPRFQHVENVWRRRGEALAKIVVPDDVVKTVGHYHFHPAVLDACFHIFKGVQDIPADAAPEDYFYLPAYIRRIRTHCDKPPTRFWAHASLVLDDGQSLVADIYVYDERGHRIADILGFRADRVKQKRVGTEVDDCLYQFRWQPCTWR